MVAECFINIISSSLLKPVNIKNIEFIRNAKYITVVTRNNVNIVKPTLHQVISLRYQNNRRSLGCIS